MAMDVMKEQSTLHDIFYRIQSEQALKHNENVRELVENTAEFSVSQVEEVLDKCDPYVNVETFLYHMGQ